VKRVCTLLTIFVLSTIAQGDPLIMLDSGHTPSGPGALGSCGKREVDYNDQFVRELQRRLKSSYQIALTRQPQKEVLPQFNRPPSSKAGAEPRASLLQRPEIANQAGARVMISIHHDSVDDSKEKGHVFFDPSICGGRGGVRMTEDFKKTQKVGYNIFVYEGGAKIDDSKLLATLVGKRFQLAGLTASNYHIKPVEDCNSCRPVDLQNGVWNQDLAILKAARMPAILIEVENILDPEFERLSDSPQYKDKMIAGIKDGLDEFCRARPEACTSPATPAATPTSGAVK
jgi:N-acetylmuramoyl-L-alanine amidase